MGYVGKVWIQAIIAACVSVVVSFVFKMRWYWIGIHTLSLVVCIQIILGIVICFAKDQKKAHSLYEVMTTFIVSYRQNRHLIESAKVLVKTYHLECGLVEQGEVDFEKLRAFHQHYLWQSIVNLIEIDVSQGDPKCIEQLYDLEEEVDSWFQAILQFIHERNRHLQSLCFLMLFSLFVAWMVMNMLHSVLPLYLTQAYQIVVGLFILLLQFYIVVIYKHHKIPLILEVECVH